MAMIDIYIYIHTAFHVWCSVKIRYKVEIAKYEIRDLEMHFLFTVHYKANLF